MDQPSPIAWLRGIDLNRIEDPKIGLALLANHPAGETQEQALDRGFWRLQFLYWRDWLAGMVTAVEAALLICDHHKRPRPSWLRKATHELCEQHMGKTAYVNWGRHTQRWRAGKLVRGQHPKDERNYKEPVLGEASWAEAAKLLADMGVEANAETMRKSFWLIERAGGGQATLQSFKRAAKRCKLTQT